MWKTAAGVCIGILVAFGIVAGGAAILLDESNDDRPPELTPDDLDDALTTTIP